MGEKDDDAACYVTKEEDGSLEASSEVPDEEEPEE